MHIDRSMFLALVSGVAVTAAIGCTVVTTPKAEPAVADGGVQPSADSGSTGSDGSVAKDSGGGGSDGGGGQDGALACLGKQELPAPDCEALGTDPNAKACFTTGNGFGGCVVVASLKSEIGIEVTKCIGALTDCPTGDPALSACVSSNIAKACDDPAADKPCQDEIDRCTANGITPNISKAQCMKVLSALNAPAIADFVSCTTTRAAGCTLDSSQYQCLDEYKMALEPPM
jgi:hypothetical protein